MFGSACLSRGPLSGGSVAASISTSRAATMRTVVDARGKKASPARPARSLRPLLSTRTKGISGSCHSCDGTAGSRGGKNTINVLKGRFLLVGSCLRKPASWRVLDAHDARRMRERIAIDERRAIDFGAPVLHAAMDKKIARRDVDGNRIRIRRLRRCPGATQGQRHVAGVSKKYGLTPRNERLRRGDC